MTEMLDRPEPGVPQLKGSRTFQAPAELVFRAWTDPELLVQWLGPRKYAMRVDVYDVRHGGTWRYVHVDDDGNEFEFRGVFHGEPSLDQLFTMRPMRPVALRASASASRAATSRSGTSRAR